MENSDLIKKTSIKLFNIINKINDENNEINKKEIVAELKKIDSELLKYFNVKLSEKDKKNALDLIKLLK